MHVCVRQDTGQGELGGFEGAGRVDVCVCVCVCAWGGSGAGSCRLNEVGRFLWVARAGLLLIVYEMTRRGGVLAFIYIHAPSTLTKFIYPFFFSKYNYTF